MSPSIQSEHIQEKVEAFDQKIRLSLQNGDIATFMQAQGKALVSKSPHQNYSGITFLP
jgi:hypothetical protein